MAVILEFFVKKFLAKLSVYIEGEIGKVLGVKEEVEKLHKKLLRISSYIQDAEKKRHTNPAINNWVKELKSIMYDAEDIFDLCLIEDGRLLEAQPFASCFSAPKFRINICNQIRRVDKLLDEIKDDNNIIPKSVEHKHEDIPVKKSSSTSPIHMATDIVGTQIVDAAQNLISKIEESKKKCTVLGISGMGGIGKTTLAQKIFNNEIVTKQFPKRVWLHISKHYNQIEILKEVLRGVGGNDNGVQSRAEVEGRIVAHLSESLLLVLDDIWSASVWNDLLRNSILNGSCRTTTILFTTRHEDVARDMKADFVHRVEKMNEDSGWKLIRKYIFGDEEDVIISELKEVGMKIVKKCDGLPLAVKVMAGVLFRKERTNTEWKKVVETDVRFWKKINDELSNTLYLSYEDLPIHLKQCFLSCAFYHGISHRSDIIRLWVAEGFVIEQSDSLMEDTAKDYYKELIARNLLQIDQRFEDGRLFVMHDVLRSFGEKLMEEDGVIISGASRTSTNSLTKIRRLSISNQSGVLSLPDEIIKQEYCLRALHLVHCPQIKQIKDHAFKSLERLRVLDLHDTCIDSLPDSLVKLSYLKYLNLDGTKIRKLSESIARLANLQTLCLSGCKSLHELPNGITKLSNLRCLQIENTPLTHVPKGVGKLKNLNHLAGFFVGHRGCDLDELQYLCKLIDLVINKLERARTTDYVLENKAFLRTLRLGWTMHNNENNDERSTEAERICKQLTPPATLQLLCIDNFPGRRFPAWMVSTSLAALTFLALVKFPSCMELPPLGQLPNLKHLHIEGGEAIRSIGPEFLGCTTPAFPKLEYLAFDSMRNWEEWVLRVARDVADPIEDAHASNLNFFPNLDKCYFCHCPKLKISILPPTRLLHINLCPNLEYVEKVGILEEFELVLPTEIKQLPQWISSVINMTLPSLQLFNMQCNSLVLGSCRKGEQNWNIIEHIPKVIIHSFGLETRLLRSKDGYKYQIKDEFGSFITHDQSSFHG